MMQPITLTVELDLDRYLRSHVGFDSEGGEVSEPTTVEDVLLDLAASQIKRQAISDGTKDAYKGLIQRVREIRDDEIRAVVIPLVQEAIATPFQSTNGYGEVTGQQTTLREQIVKAATDYMSNPADRYSRDKGTVVQQFIKAEVEKAVKAELKQALDDAKAEVAAAVKDHAATMIQQTVAQLAGVR